MRKLGDNQESILRSLVSHRPGKPLHERDSRPYPGGGWCWSNHSTTVRLLESLERRGLVNRRTVKGSRSTYPQWVISEAGREHLKGKTQ